MNTKRITDKLGITANAMQNAAFDAIIKSNNDVVILSPTGSGKTYAYLIPVASMLDASIDRIQAIVLVPGRELALQSANVLKSMGLGLRSMALYGGRPTMDEHRKLRDIKPQIVFATPGRLNDHLAKNNIEATSIQLLIIDEFDKMLEMGFADEMSSVIERLGNVRRHILLSATDANDIPSYLHLADSAIRLDFLPKDEDKQQRVSIFKVDSPSKDKLETLCRLLLSFGDDSSVVFLNYRDSVERTAEYLAGQGFTVSIFHGGLDQQTRERNLYKFSNGSANILVCTDLASRGLDIPDINNIIHYHLPESEDGYIHRVGRTARWDKKGRAFFILSENETVPSYVDADIASFDIPTDIRLGSEPPKPKMVTVYIGKGKHDKISKGDIVGFLCKKGGLKGDEIGKIDVYEYYSYAAIPRKKAAQVIKLTKNEKIKGVKTIVEEVK